MDIVEFVGGWIVGKIVGVNKTNTEAITHERASKLALSRIEAADILGVSTVSIDRLVKRGLLRPSRATRRPLFPIWELERFLRDTSKEIAL